MKLATSLLVLAAAPLAAQGVPGQLTFSSSTHVGRVSPERLVVGHIEPGGIPDLFLWASPDLLVYRGIGGGNFAPPIVNTFTTFGLRVDFGDLDGDGCDDMAAADGFQLQVWLGDCQGGFVANGTYPVPGLISNDCAVDDFNGDGRLDVVVTYGDLFAPTGFRLFLGLGNGALMLADDEGGSIFDIATSADVDGDGRADVIGLIPGDFTVVYGEASGGLCCSVTPFPSTFAGVAVADFDKSGTPDLVGDGTPLQTFLDSSSGSFASPVASSVGLTSPRELATGDFDLDGRLDIAALDVGSRRVTVALGAGDGTFGAGWTAPQTPEFAAAVAADFDGDGMPDIAAAKLQEPRLHVYINQTVPSLWEDLGESLAGAAGAPLLTGTGPLTGGSTVALDVTGAAPSSGAVLLAGSSYLGLPILSGVLVPFPDAVLTGVLTDSDGALTHTFPWPAGVPTGAKAWFQAWVFDLGAPEGWAASNGLSATAP